MTTPRSLCSLPPEGVGNFFGAAQRGVAVATPARFTLILRCDLHDPHC